MDDDDQDVIEQGREQEENGGMGKMIDIEVDVEEEEVMNEVQLPPVIQPPVVQADVQAIPQAQPNLTREMRRFLQSHSDGVYEYSKKTRSK
jgi:hypothetical protein